MNAYSNIIVFSVSIWIIIMTVLLGKHIILGISGGIAAYKCPEIVRRLHDHGAKVRVVMTTGAKAFITPLTLQAVSGFPVADSLFDPASEAAMGHIELGKWADLVVLAPATVDLIARITVGMANDLLSTLCLATSAPIAVAPAMNQQMYHASITQTNIQILSQRGFMIWGPEHGSQACGDVGLGRMLDPLKLVALIEQHCARKQDLSSYRFLITAGPTREALDPVRFISNYSSGKMGFAIAAAARKRGSQVTLVSGPVNLPTPPGVDRIDVESAQQMHQVVMQQTPQHQIFISCAAVADYRAKQPAEQKIKKQENEILLKLVKNPDIVAEVAAMQTQRPFVVGFAAETDNMEEYAKEKLVGKNLDMICANYVSLKGKGFNTDTNVLHLFWSQGDKVLPLSYKTLLGDMLIDEIVTRYEAKN